MTSNGSIRLVCFDLGGVIVRTRRTWKDACVAAGLEPRGPWASDSQSPPALKNLILALNRGEIGMDAWTEHMSAKLDGLYSPQEVHRAHAAVLIGEYEGVAGVIDRIHAAGFQTAALSNTDEGHWPMLQNYPAIRKLQHRHASHLLGYIKPEPAIYTAFQSRVGVEPHEILFFDDLPENIEAARTVGWQAELIDPFSRTDAQIVAAVNRHRAI